ncbi:acyltransferase [Faecalibacter sp. LW9]|uniref:acyltransferase family protein n=1 Tax=Faecalibacter sp. LW9 TaxID=3103144 RepID=UPI002AFDD108|nr:acyltransferase [Faecalibacter sp. LW9]
MKYKLPNLNSLRLIAASLVMIHHTEQLKSLYELPNLWNNQSIYTIGKLGVVLFFVLSGFLITHLLLNEVQSKGKINIKNFFVRRILRIWPLYYTILILAFFIFPFITFFEYPEKAFFINGYPLKQLLLYIFMLPNLAVSNLDSIAYASQSWSIGTEEQFYLIWPFLFFFFKNKKLFISILSIIPLYLIFKYFLESNNINILGLNIKNFWQFFNIDCMAIGGVIAFLNHRNYDKIKFLLNKKIFWTTTILTTILIVFGVNFGFFHYEVYACLFIVIIYNLAFNNQLKELLEYKIMDKLGEISYGMYMYHVIIISIAIKIMKSYNFYNNTLLYIIIFCITISVSRISYEFLEKPFLKLKKKFL